MFMRLTSSDPHQATNQKKIWDSLLPSMKQPSLDLQSQAILHWIWSLDIWPGLWPGLCSWRDADGGGFLGVCGNKIWWFHPWKKIIHVGSCNTHDIPTIVEDKCEVSNQIGITDYNGIYGIVISVYLYIIIYMCEYHPYKTTRPIFFTFCWDQNTAVVAKSVKYALLATGLRMGCSMSLLTVSIYIYIYIMFLYSICFTITYIIILCCHNIVVINIKWWYVIMITWSCHNLVMLSPWFFMICTAATAASFTVSPRHRISMCSGHTHSPQGGTASARLQHLQQMNREDFKDCRAYSTSKENTIAYNSI